MKQVGEKGQLSIILILLLVPILCSFLPGSTPPSLHTSLLVCYYGQHYYCFAYSHDHERWVMYDDKTVKVIGGWDNVLTKCEKGKLQPQVLFFEAVN